MEKDTTKIKYGYIPDIIHPDDYVFGGRQIAGLPLVLDGQWDEFLPTDEYQNINNVETQNCTSFGTLNALEILINKVFKIKANYSDRFLGIVAGTNPSGNSPHKVAETIRKYGNINEELLPFNSTITEWKKYYSPFPMTDKFLKEAKKWLSKYDFKHEWVANNSKDLKNALCFSPLGVSVYAWEQKGGYYVKPEGATDNHWVILYGFEDGKYWQIFDSYDNTKKQLDWNFKFGLVKRYSISPMLKKNFLKVIHSFFLSLFNKFRNI